MTDSPREKIRARGLEKVFQVRGSRQAGGPRRERAAGSQYVALRDFDLDVREGEFLAVVGPSGCGKTTFLNFVGGLDHPDSGELLLDDRPITGPGLDRGVVFQQYALFPWRTALENVAFGLEVKGVARRDRLDRARRYLRLVGLGAFTDRYPHELSGGMKQRVALARALAFDPDVLLMDEPFAALDTQTREILQRELLRIWQRTHKTVIFITHSIEEAVFLAQRVAVMTAGPGRVKEIVDIDLPPVRSREEDIRSSAAFSAYRHGLWELLREEVAKAQPELGTFEDDEFAVDLDAVPEGVRQLPPGRPARPATVPAQNSEVDDDARVGSYR